MIINKCLYNIPIIVSCTSWKKRIAYTPRLIKNMLLQTLLPTKIILNLSSNEFVNKLEDLPEELVILSDIYKKIFEINWVKEDTGAYKKVIPTIQRYYYTDCYILGVDEDWEYSDDYIETMVKYANLYPTKVLSPGIYHRYVHGYASIYRPQWFNKILWSITKVDCDILPCSDRWIARNLSENKKLEFIVISEIAKKMKPIYLNDPLYEKYISIPLEKLHEIENNLYNKYKNLIII